MNIEFGCGENPTKEGYLTCDIRDLPGIDFVCPAWEIHTRVAEESVDNIFSRHFFEHLTFEQGRVFLENCRKILKPGGSMEMMLPNMSFHIMQWIDGREEEHARAGFYGWQRGAFDDTWDVHKSGYTSVSLRKTLAMARYTNIKSLRPVSDKHLHMIAYKNAGDDRIDPK